jgi:hypothetical protein
MTPFRAGAIMPADRAWGGSFIGEPALAVG